MSKLVWKDRIFVGKRAEKQLNKILKQLESDEWIPGLFLLTVSASAHDQIDLVNASMIPAYFRRTMLKYLQPVVGIALGRREAYQVLCEIVNESITVGKPGNLRSVIEDSGNSTGKPEGGES